MGGRVGPSVEDDGWVLRATGLTLAWLFAVIAVGGLWSLSTLRSSCEAAPAGVAGDGMGMLNACARTVGMATRPAAVGMAIAAATGSAVIAVATRFVLGRRLA